MLRLPQVVGLFLRLGGGALRLPALYFHDVPTECRENFASLIAELTAQYRFVRLDELADLNDDDEPRAMLMFDDALVSLLDNAIPILERHNCPATVFVPTGWVGKKARWTERTISLGWEVMSWKTIVGLDSPMLRFEGHTVSHPRLRELSHETIVKEFADSKTMLEEKLSRAVEYLCYPFGQYDRRSVQAARETGYRGAFSSINSIWQPRSAPYEMRRLLCEADVSIAVAERLLVGQGEWRGLHQYLRNRLASVAGRDG